MRLIIITALLTTLLAIPSVKAENASTPAVEEMTATDKIENKKESEIPLNLQSPKKASEDGHSIFKIILIFSMMGLVGTGAYIYMRKYAKNNFAAGKNNQIKVLTQHYLGPKKSLAIIRVAGESILIGVTDNNINMIKSLALLDDEIPEEVHSSSFSDVFGGVPAHVSEENDEEEFSIRGIKEVVSKKLKGMRSFQ
ncbi:MAG TPA: flagellar biosynthetic protein FliO [Pseudobdellovibrionaceae bacterium]|jgi:flagellar protein FliO/FliZ